MNISKYCLNFFCDVIVSIKKTENMFYSDYFINTYLDISNKIHFNWCKHGGAQLVWGEKIHNHASGSLKEKTVSS